MFYDKKFININNELFVIKRTFKAESFEKIVANFPSNEICDAYHCDTILRGKDGIFFLVDKVNEAIIVNP
tara:strand:+ start:132 stop:341 length:210 start_codon:yes stop_codon:yes gene_type:complete